MKPHNNPATEKRFVFSILLTGLIFLAELVGGWWTGSLALLSDAAHVFLDVFALGLSYVALRLSARPPDDRHTFGYHRLEVLAALLNGVAIPVRAGLTNANFVLPEAATGAPALLDLVASVFSLRSATPKPILGVGFSALLLLAFVLVVSFLFTNAERQAREAAASREI